MVSINDLPHELLAMICLNVEDMSDIVNLCSLRPFHETAQDILYRDIFIFNLAVAKQVQRGLSVPRNAARLRVLSVEETRDPIHEQELSTAEALYNELEQEAEEASALLRVGNIAAISAGGLNDMRFRTLQVCANWLRLLRNER